MTAQEFLVKMQEMQEIAKENPEEAHVRADETMCDLLRELGYGAGVTVFEKMTRWYS